MTGLGHLPGDEFSTASGVSANGSVVVGSSSASGVPEAFYWTSDAGMVGLGDLPGGAFSSIAEAVSSDGLGVVGSAHSESGREAFRWTGDGGMIGLGDLPGGLHQSGAADVSADGSIVVGWGTSAGGQEAIVWDSINGLRSLNDILSGLGAQMTGWTLTAATAISADATTVVGQGINPSGRTEAWVANLTTVPEPSMGSLLSVAAVSIMRRRAASRVARAAA